MRHSENSNIDGEYIIFSTKLHWIIFFGPFITVFISFLFWYGQITGNKLIITLSAIWLIHTLIDYEVGKLIVTSKGLIIKYGFFKRVHKEIYFTQIEALEVEQSIFGRLLNYGTITIKGTGSTFDKYPTIEAPERLRRKIKQQITAAKTA